MITHIADYCPLCGTQTEQVMRDGRLRPVCLACGHTVYFDPKVAAIAFAIQDNKVLLVQRAMEPGQGLWGMPGGFVELNEHPQETVRRELLEETDLKVEVERLLDVFLNDNTVTIAYAVQVVDGSIKAGDDAAKVGWFSKDALPKLVFTSTIELAHRWRNGEL